MQYIASQVNDTYKVALLVKDSSFHKGAMWSNYVMPLVDAGLDEQDMIAVSVLSGNKSKLTVKIIKEDLDKTLPILKDLKVELLYVTDSNYFKVLTGATKVDSHFGYALPCKLKGYEDFKVVIGINYQAIIFNPLLQEKLDMSLAMIPSILDGTHVPLGNAIIYQAFYPETLEDIQDFLDSLHAHPRLSCDIEAFSLNFTEAGIATIAFAWDQNNGGAFACDYARTLSYGVVNKHGYFRKNQEVRKMIKGFLESYAGELVFHRATYDVKVLIYTLWMKDPLDTAGLLEGLHTICSPMHDTRIVAYLATNSTADVSLALKALAHEFAGNWALDTINDICLIPLYELLEYNLVDALATNYVLEKYYPIMVADEQEEIYKTLMMPSQKVIIQLELTGMPMQSSTIQSTKKALLGIQAKALEKLTNNPVMDMLNVVLQTSAMKAANAKLKVKQHPLEKYKDVVFNPNSVLNLQELLYSQMGLPIIDTTPSKQPSTGADTLEKLIHHTNEPTYKEILRSLIDYNKVTKLLSTFIPAFEKGIKKEDGMIWLHGNFNLGGTVSGRLSSSEPNLQNIPSGSEYAKLIKEAFQAPPGWLFGGADFNSLEDMISALTTKDPNKLKVYTDGYCGHCLRAYSYFKEECVGIVDTVESINSIKQLYPNLRQDSKGPTFLLTYRGTWRGMMKNLGWPEDKSKAIEKGYHELYVVSDQYVEAKLEQASKDGYVTVAFGLRVRTPLLKQVMWGSPRVPYEAQAEGRTAANALGQSYGLLNNRAAVAFMQRVWNSEYALDIKPVALIHDAIYILMRDRADVVEWANRELIAAMTWQELPEIQHDTVKLGASLGIFWPTWATELTIPNNATKELIISLCENHKREYANVTSN